MSVLTDVGLLRVSRVCVRLVARIFVVIWCRIFAGRPNSWSAPVIRGCEWFRCRVRLLRALLKLVNSRVQVVVLLRGPSRMWRRPLIKVLCSRVLLLALCMTVGTCLRFVSWVVC